MTVYALQVDRSGGVELPPKVRSRLVDGDVVLAFSASLGASIEVFDVKGEPPELHPRVAEVVVPVPEWLRARGPELTRVDEADWPSLAELLLHADPVDAVDDEAWDDEAAAPAVLAEQLLQDLADRTGTSVGGRLPGEPRPLDEPLVLLHADEPVPDEPERMIRQLRGLEQELTRQLLARHLRLWNAFVEEYPSRLAEQPPACAELAEIPLGVKARLCRWLAWQPAAQIPDDLRPRVGEVRELRDRIVFAYVRLASNVSREVWHRGLPWRLRLPIATAGLIRALDTYDPDGPAGFATYARFWVQAVVSRETNECGQRARHPGYLADVRMKSTKALRGAVMEGRPLAWTPDLVDRLLSACGHRGLQARTLEASLAPILSDGSSALEPVALTSHDVEREREAWRALLKAVDELRHERSRRIVRERLGLHEARRSLQEIGDDWGLSRERVRQIEREAKRLLWVSFGRPLLDAGYGSDGRTSPTSSGSPSSSS